MTEAQVQSPSLVAAKPKKSKVFRYTKKALKRIIPLGLMAYFIPKVLLVFVVCGILDVLRNRPLSWDTTGRYLFGNGVLTWILSPFNLLMDLISLPYWNKGIYKLTDLPKGYQTEIQTLIDAAHNRDLVSALESKM